MIAGKRAVDGSLLPFSQLMRVDSEIPMSAQASFCVRPRSSRRRLMCSPSVVGSAKTWRGFKHLSRTWTHGKKATRKCPCGHAGSARCRCSPDQIARYRSKLSGPLLDRIDIVIEVPLLDHADMMGQPAGEPSEVVRARVERAWALQCERQRGPNSRLAAGHVDTLCAPDADGRALLAQALGRLNLSARGYHRILKVARTIADLAGAERVGAAHLAEAIQYRRGLDAR